MGFSAVAVIKSKYCSKINVEQEIRVAVSSLILALKNFEEISKYHPIDFFPFFFNINNIIFLCISSIYTYMSLRLRMFSFLCLIIIISIQLYLMKCCDLL
ncbi:hypothetical protein X975_19661, partial [Stegodyphus mimosarum]